MSQFLRSQQRRLTCSERSHWQYAVHLQWFQLSMPKKESALTIILVVTSASSTSAHMMKMIGETIFLKILIDAFIMANTLK